MAKKQVKLPGCAGCEWGAKKESCFVPPELIEKPELIIYGEAPGKTEYETKIPFSGESGGVIRGLLTKHGVRYSVINSANCWNEEKPTTDVLSNCRDAYNSPILKSYPNVPVLALGAYAASSILGGKRSDKKLPGSVRVVDGREVYFTYHPAYYLREGKAAWVLENIETMLKSCLASTRNRQRVEYTTIPIPEEFWKSEFVYLDIETWLTDNKYQELTDSPLMPQYGSKIRIIGVANEQSDLVYIVEPNSDFFERLSTYSGSIVGHNINYDASHLLYAGVDPLPRLEDTLIRLKCKSYNPNWSNSLKWVAKSIFGIYGYEAICHTKWKDKEEPSFEELVEYNAMDVILTKSLFHWLKQNDDNLDTYRLSMAYLPHIIQMEANGAKVDVDKLDEIETKVDEEIEKTQAEISKIVGLPVRHGQKKKKDPEFFNPGSWKQILAFLSKEGVDLPDTSEDTLEKNLDKHPFIPRLLDLRGIEKTKSTYCVGYRHWLTEDNYLHSTYGVQGTETGRCNSTDPNLQNAPKVIRPIFVSRYEGGKLISPDCSALEYRIIGHDSQDPILVKLFNDGKDVHKIATSIIFELPEAKIDSALRRDGKTLNFAAAYQCGFERFSSGLGRKDWATFMKVKNLYPGVDAYRRKLMEELHETGYISNLFGRRRWFGRYCSEADEREAFNWRIQSTGHDIFKVIAIRIQNLLLEKGISDYVRWVQEGHDSGNWDTPFNLVGAVTALIRGISLNSLIKGTFGVSFSVPLLLDVKIMDRWE